ncbi:poly-gamma-glutamate synthesis protein (capsule biosynthesis protein) [Quadrisphaera granulorum]|uniref:Poly-gamma-glutamate synthesis protein (Capsule biosynthesis protein) n=1 Tax=Quadrisphaera granulorum TaxID=317664 RepID=A0A316ABX0_9ACTN|nr:CapA family protein [Quadrisphaera granulorum]PWJ55205.1 poly-gamma-glutamate synthesis protein (capsule biosynthesis protein) [Quadrisphaera granulorum]SZE95714.1 poly-gamma-glutamate synthesis protein (capsule biosynthesis protein) [Quadrisphaera granulorum]
MSRRALGLLLVAAALVAGSGCSPASEPDQAATSSQTSTDAEQVGHDGGATAVLAFAGDVHFEGTSASTTELGSAFDVLAQADLAVVNLETAVTTGGTKVEKQFAFRAPPAAMTALEDAGIDAVTIANNHGMDYGASGLEDTLAAGKEAGLPVLGAGDDVEDAFAPLRVEPKGVPVSVIAATDVIDSSVQTAWTATATKPGLASAKDEKRLLRDVRTEAEAGRVVVVFLHWGTERVQCPTSRQRSLAADLAEAGAAVVVGSHAHVLQPTGEVGSTLVAYGLGNFHFYAKPGNTLGTQTGVLTVEVSHDGVKGSQWHPAVIRNGKPELLTGGSAGGRSPDELADLGRQCASGATPSAAPKAPVGGDGGDDGGDDGSDGGGDDGGAAPSQSPSAPSASPVAPSGEPGPVSPSEPVASPTESAQG